MTVITPASGSPETWVKNLPDTADYTIATASDARAFRIESIVAACASGGSTFSLWVDDGANDVFVLNAKAISANDYLKLEHPIVLKSGWALKCKDHTGAKISVTATLAITSKQTTG
jgi:hypothetical protein